MASIHPAITHEPTRRFLAEGRLPDVHELMRFTPLAEGRVVTVSRLVGEEFDPADLDPYIAGLVAVGNVPVETHDAQEIVVDGRTGRVFSLQMYSPRHARILPFAPSLEVLARFLEAVDELVALRGRFADLVGRSGAEVVEAASERLLSVFAEEAAGWVDEIPAFWRIAALIRPLALIARPGRGLLLDLPTGLMEEEFGAAEVVRVDPAQLPAGLEHGSTRRFLAEVGLPKDGLMFSLDDDPETLLETLSEERERLSKDPALHHLGRLDRLPPDADRLLVLGGLMHDFEVVIDGRTGEVHYVEWGADTVTPVNADISTLAFTVWMHSRQQSLDKEHRLTDDFYHQLADTMIAALASVDPIACLPASGPDDYRYWPEVFHDEAGGVL
ncbi:SUKH-4 family immunity protein [Streptomyces sp. NPDC000229]|uniref:SUKH-4 family immunity protein n=1 Tax=Streptomyces sp. NPDC000229 TaxID=3154247 RepID=UPI00332F176A